MAQSRLSALAGTGATTLLVVICGMATGLASARVLGPEGRGELFVLTLWASTFLYAGMFGIPDAVAYRTAADPQRRVQVWTTGQMLALLLGVLATGVGWWVLPALLTGPSVGLVPASRLYLLLFLLPGLSSHCAVGWLQGRGDLKSFNVTRLSVPLVSTIGMAALWLAGVTSIGAFAAALLAGNATGWLLGIGYGPWRQGLSTKPDPALAKEMLGYGARVQFGTWSNLANAKLDQLILTVLIPAASLGLYVVAITYAALLTTLSSSASLVMLPDMIRRNGGGQAPECLAQWYRRVLWVVLAAGTLLLAAAGFIVPLLFGPAFTTAVPIVWILVPATAVLGMNQILSVAFRAIGRPGIASQAELVGLVVTVLGLWALLPRYGIYGAAFASLLAYSVIQCYLLVRIRTVLRLSGRDLWIPDKNDFAAARTVVDRARRKITAR